jgi:hypothetical protein
MAGSARRLPDSGDLASGCLLGGARALFHVLGGVALLVLSFGNAELRPFYLIYWAVFMALLALGSLPSIFRSWTDEIAIVIGLLAGVVVPARTAQIGFYEASAQIIPVLLLALAIELRAFRVVDVGPLETRHRFRLAFLPGFALLVAGAESLRVLVSGNAASGSLRVVVGALTMAAVSLILRVMFGSPEDGSDAAANAPGPREPHGDSSDADY